MKIAILMTCHNRKAITRECLARLMPQLAADDKVFLLDDGSTDGTGDMVRTGFPSVKIIHGDGSLYWSRGMRVAWETSIAHDEWNGWLWLNDDTLLEDDALCRMLQCAEINPGSVVLGALKDISTGARIYGKSNDGLFCGNCVYVPKEIVSKVGMISDAYHHAWGDYDYAHKCRRKGIKWVEVETTVGKTYAHELRPSLKGKTFAERWHLLRQPKGWCIHDLWVYRIRNYGFLVAIASCIHMIVHVMLAETR